MPELANHVVRSLRSHGFQAWLVGGCVRDIHLGIQPKDYDVATDATPDQIIRVFPQSGLVGAHFGVVVVKGDNEFVEVATFRQDHDYSDGRRPDSVSFVKEPKEDAARRDFTINAMFMDQESGHTIDFFGGLQDLQDGVIRTVDNPDIRFAEDYIRLLRAVRFATRLGFTIENRTESSMTSHSHNITKMAMERVHGELVPILSHVNVAQGVQILIRTGLLQKIMPEANVLTAQHRFSQVKEPAFPLSMALLLAHCNNDEIVSAMNRLKCTAKEIAETAWLVAHQNSLVFASWMQPCELKRLLRDHRFNHLQEFCRIVSLIENDDLIYVSECAARWTQNDLYPTPLINGDTLINLGFVRGPSFRVALRNVEDAQLNNKISTVDEAIEIACRCFQ